MLIGSISVRHFLILHIGNEVNGLDSLYTSLIGFLSVAELGVGSAITFCMYKPIVEGNDAKVAALYQLFTKSYLIIGAIMLVVGIGIIPFLPYLAKDYAEIDVNLGLTFFLMLLSIIMSYVFSAKTSLINAYKNNYVTTTISSLGMLLQYALQIVTIIATQSFVGYLICRIAAMVFQWAATEWYSGRHYKEIIKHGKESVDGETKKEIINKVKALFMHRIGGILVNSADSIIISAFIGVVVLGKYSNYSTIAVSMSSVLVLVFTPLTSIIGHTYISEREKTEQYFQWFYFLNFVLGVVFFLGYYAVIDDLVMILFGNNLKLSKSVSFVITLNYFVQFIRQATLLFRDATGTFYNDRWKPLFEGLLNVVLSIALVKLFERAGGDELGVVGVIAATIVTNLMICHIVEPYVLYKYAFGKSPKKHIILNYICILVFVVAVMALSALMREYENSWIELLVNGLISIGISACIILAALLFNKNARERIRGKFRRKS